MSKYLSLLLACFMLLAGCTSAGAPADETGRITVVSTIFPGYDFARAVAGDDVNLKMLLPPGSETHTFEPTPQDMITIAGCDLFIYVGGDSDAWVDEILTATDTSAMAILRMMDVVDVVEEEIKEGMEHSHSHDDNDLDDHDRGDVEYDEHVWTSPRNAVRIVGAVADALCLIDGDSAGRYRANAERYVADIEAVDAAFRDVVAGAARDTLIVADRFPFRYFVDRYGLDYYAAFPGCSTESGASAKTIAFLIDKVRDEAIPVVFYIEFSSEEMADTICEATGADKRLLHSGHNVSRQDIQNGVTYVELMWSNVETLKEALA